MSVKCQEYCIEPLGYPALFVAKAPNRWNQWVPKKKTRKIQGHVLDNLILDII